MQKCPYPPLYLCVAVNLPNTAFQCCRLAIYNLIGFKPRAERDTIIIGNHVTSLFCIVMFVSRPVVDRGIISHQFDLFCVYFNCVLLVRSYCFVHIDLFILLCTFCV